LGFNAVHDGTSNSLLFSERVISKTSGRTIKAAGNNCVLSGESPFGIWGAFGSVDGGEGKGL
jgi:hypothetical protein